MSCMVATRTASMLRLADRETPGMPTACCREPYGRSGIAKTLSMITGCACPLETHGCSWERSGVIVDVTELAPDGSYQLPSQ